MLERYFESWSSLQNFPGFDCHEFVEIAGQAAKENYAN
jgi:hypothetical protein